MEKKKASELKEGDRINLGGVILVVKSIELSEIGKHGTKKCRIEANKLDNEKVILIRPAEYPFNLDL